MKKILLVCALATLGFIPAHTANALPGQCWNTPFGGFCDGAAQMDGSFNHCENIGFGSSGFQKGDRYGEVTKVGTKYLHVQMDSGRKRKFVIEGRDGFDPRVSSLRPVRRNEL